MRERSKETNQQTERWLYKKTPNGYLAIDLTVLPQMECPESEREVFFPIDYGEGILEKTREILKGLGGIERGVFPGLIKAVYLPPNLAVPVRVIRAFIPRDPNKKTELAIKLSESLIAFTNPERALFSGQQLLREKPEI
jgi:hypothetical protein